MNFPRGLRFAAPLALLLAALALLPAKPASATGTGTKPTGLLETYPAGTVAAYTIDFSNVDDIAYVGVNQFLVFGASTRDPAPFDLTPRLTGFDDLIRISLYNTWCYNTSLDMTITRTMNGVKTSRTEHFGPEWWGWNCGQVDKVNWTYRVNRNTGLFQRFNWSTGIWESI
jgi:hypothetical protein